MSTPHKPILTRYETGEDKHRYVRDLFNRGAQHYDRIGKVGFFGTGHFYRKRALQKGGLTSGMKVIDVACGTGAVTRAILEIVHPEGSVLGVDPSEGMLGEAKKNIVADFKIGRAEELPAEDNQFDFLSMGYALRHVEDLVVAFKEYRRVLKPGGKLLLLEISLPKSKIGLMFTKLYFRDFVPFLSRLTTGSKDAREMMDYYWETIDACVPPDDIIAALKAAGFKNVDRRVELGIFSEYRAEK
jgi:demethylmenaquinone methyltransferase / 2-methoxy-6-polyprenyl-1,4-benzoquinol methylase